MAYKSKKTSSGDKRFKNYSTTTRRGPGEGPGSRSFSYKSGTNGPRFGTKTKTDKNGCQVTVESKTWKDASGYWHRQQKTKPHAGSPSSKPKKTKTYKSPKVKTPKPHKFPKVKSYSLSSSRSTRRRSSGSDMVGFVILMGLIVLAAIYKGAEYVLTYLSSLF